MTKTEKVFDLAALNLCENAVWGDKTLKDHIADACGETVADFFSAAYKFDGVLFAAVSALAVVVKSGAECYGYKKAFCETLKTRYPALAPWSDKLEICVGQSVGVYRLR